MKEIIIYLILAATAVANTLSHDKEKLRDVARVASDTISAVDFVIEISLINENVNADAGVGAGQADFERFITSKFSVSGASADTKTIEILDELLNVDWVKADDLGPFSKVRIKITNISRNKSVSIFVHRMANAVNVQGNWYVLPPASVERALKLSRAIIAEECLILGEKSEPRSR